MPYNGLIFIKKDSSYKASFTISYEIKDYLGAIIDRKFSDNEVSADNFSDTDSKTRSQQGIIKSNIKEGKYFLSALFIDKNGKGEFKSPDIYFEIKSKKETEILPPIVINSIPVKCNNRELSCLTNWENNIPFSSNLYDLVIPVPDTLLKINRIEILKDLDTIFKSDKLEWISFRQEIDTCGSNVLFVNSLSLPVKSFILRNISKSLPEGNFLLSIYSDKKMLKQIPVVVKWYNKPFVLFMPEIAIKVLKYVEKKETVDSLLKLDKDDYYTGLNRYWKRYDPTPETEFNELMNEFYSRVDYAAINYSTINGKKGFDTDRGMIYIMNGKPNNIERGFNAGGKITETWYYEKLNKKFDFIDQSGTGEFKLVNS